MCAIASVALPKVRGVFVSNIGYLDSYQYSHSSKRGLSVMICAHVKFMSVVLPKARGVFSS